MTAVSGRSVEIDKKMTGELRKQSAHIGLFRRRNVVLCPLGLQIYHVGDAEKALSIVPITADTVVSETKLGTVRGSHGAAHHDQALFQVIPNESQTSYRPRIFGSGTEEHWFSASSMELAQQWKSAIEAQAKALKTAKTQGEANAGISKTMSEEDSERDKPKTLIMTESYISREDKRRNLRENLKRSASVHFRSLPQPMTQTINLIQQASWRQVLVTNGVRIMAEVALAKENPCLRISCVLPCSPDRASRLYYNFDRRSEWDNMTESVTVIKDKDDDDGHMQTHHCKLKGQKVGGLWMAPRDYVVDSSWRKDDDGSVVILETSSKGHIVPPVPGYVRAEIFALGITLCPRRRKPRDNGDDPIETRFSRRVLGEGELNPDDRPGAEREDCLLQMAVHANVGGWLAKMPLDWSQHWLYAFMLRVIGFRQVLEEDNYQSVDFNQWTNSNRTTIPPKETFSSSLASVLPSSSSNKKDLPETSSAGSVKDVAKMPEVKGTLPKENVYNITDPFNLRSKTYLQDRKKEPSGLPMFELIAMDLWEVDAPIENVAMNMKGGLADTYLNAPGPKPYMFIIQFQVPGPPCLSFVAYFAARPGVIETISPFSKLFADFIEGTDEFRDSRFKFIPRVVKGSYVVKSAVGQTPALLGNKLVCTYHKGKDYFEVDVDVGSSNVAGGVLRVVKGYITALTIDMCFLLEAQDVEELPEVVLGSLRFERLSLDMAKKWVPKA